MATRTFTVHLEADVEIEIDDRAIDTVDDSWRQYFYDLETPEDIAGHIAYNMVVNRLGLSRMDGWADLDNMLAVIIAGPDWEISARVST